MGFHTHRFDTSDSVPHGRTAMRKIIAAIGTVMRKRQKMKSHFHGNKKALL